MLRDKIARAVCGPIHDDEDRSDQTYDDVDHERFLRIADAVLEVLRDEGYTLVKDAAEEHGNPAATSLLEMRATHRRAVGPWVRIFDPTIKEN